MLCSLPRRRTKVRRAGKKVTNIQKELPIRTVLFYMVLRLYSQFQNLGKLSEVLDCTNHLACVGVLVVVPGNNLYLVCVIVDLCNHCLCCIEE